ncbi:MAG: hypothetical protein AB7G28_18150 [Pirellulales bacterium]
MLRRLGRLCRLWCAAAALGAALGSSGCNLIIPQISHQPVVHNPFPQLSKVAIVPFFNQSDEPTVDGREFALAYFAELQDVPGFEVVPLGVVEEAIQYEQIDLSNPAGIRRLADVLEVDAVVVGAVTDFSQYYPPRCGMRVEWYARNPGFHEIPAGYGLPWGTPDEEFIPAPLVFEAELALAKAQLATQSPNCATAATTNGPAKPPGPVNGDDMVPEQSPINGDKMVPGAKLHQSSDHQQASYEQTEELQVDQTAVPAPDMSGATAASGTTGAIGLPAMLPPDWPDERGFIPPPPSPVRPPCLSTDGPVMTHTRIYIGNSSEFTEALASYYSFQDDARFGGWQTYLERSSDFIRFCCHMHISEMLSARGGAGESRVVWRWPENR